MAFSLSLGAISVALQLNAEQFKKGVEDSKKSWGSLKGEMMSIGKTLGAGSALAAGGVALVAKAAGDLQMELTKAASVSADGMKAFGDFKAAAMDASAGSMASAKDAAQALKYLAMAGFSTADAMTALPEVIRLSAAAGLDLATASDVASDMLSGFGLKAKDLSHVNDVLALGFNRTNTSLELLFESMKYVAPAATSAGQSIETMTAAVGLMSNVGIKGSQAGTSMRMALLRLQDPPKKAREALDALGITVVDQSGKMRDFVDIIGDFERAQSKMGQADYTSKVSKVVGVEAVSGFLGVINQGEAALRKLRDEMVTAKGTAADLEKQMMSTFSGQMQVLKGNVENLAAQLGDAFLPTLTKVIAELTAIAVAMGKDSAAAAQWSTDLTNALHAVGGMVEMAGVLGQIMAYGVGIVLEAGKGWKQLTMLLGATMDMYGALVVYMLDGDQKLLEANQKKYQATLDQVLALGDFGSEMSKAAKIGDQFANTTSRVAEILEKSQIKIEAQTKKVKTQEEAIKDATKALSDYAATWRGVGEGANFVEQPRWMLGPQNRFKTENTNPDKPNTRDAAAAKRAAEERAQAKIREEIAAMELDALRTRDDLMRIDKQAQADIEALRLRQLGTLEKELEIASILVRAEKEKEGWIKKQADEMERRAEAEKKAQDKIGKEMIDFLDIDGTDAKKKAKAVDDRSSAIKGEERQARERMAKSIAPMISLAGGFADMLGEFGGSLKKVLGVGSAALQGFVEGGAMGALEGGLMALAGSIMSTIGESQAFQDNLAVLGSLFEGLGVSDIIDSFFESFQPAIGAIISVFQSFGGAGFDGMFEALGRATFNAVKGMLQGFLFLKKLYVQTEFAFKDIVTNIFNGFNTMVNKLAAMVDSIPGMDRPDTSMINDAFHKMAAERDALRETLGQVDAQQEALANLSYDAAQAIYDETLERNKSTESMKELNDELRNAPSGFKIALARFNAQDAAAGAAAGGGGSTTRGQGLSVGNVLVFGDPKTLLSGLSRRQFIATGTTSPVVQRYAAKLAGRP